MEKKKRRQKHCGEIALTRSRQARRQKKHPILVGWIFIATLLSIRPSNSSPAMPHVDTLADDWPISDYERGFSTSLKPHGQRYREQPSMKRLMRDLRRPAARDEATKFLLARIDDVALRGWVIEQIRSERINRLEVHVHHSLPDTAIIASWQAELDAENIANDETLNDAVEPHLTPGTTEL